MKIVFRKPPALREDPEFIVGVLWIPLSGAVLALVLLSRLPVFCLFHRLTGFPCPACGTFRCAEHLAAGQFREAWLTQPLAATFVLLAIAYVIYSWIVVLLQLPRLRVEGMTRRRGWLIAGVSAAAVAANWVYIAFHGV